MKQVFKLLLACAVGVLPMSVGAKDSEATEVRKMIDKVNQHWQAENSPEVRSFWDNAVYHTETRLIVLILKLGQTITSGRGRRVITVRSGNILMENRISMFFLVTTRFVSRLIPICTI